jgi:putative PIN family toxin of toxin-antitoxin system
MIVTFDSSILVRATKRSQGPARRVIDALAARPDHTIALSPFILGEVGKVLSYPRMQALFGLTAEEIHGHVDFLRAISRVVEPQIGLPVVLLDPNDDAVLYTAVAAGADILCVRDRHFYDDHVLTFCARENILVMDELTLLEILAHSA